MTELFHRSHATDRFGLAQPSLDSGVVENHVVRHDNQRASGVEFGESSLGNEGKSMVFEIRFNQVSGRSQATRLEVSFLDQS